MTTAAYSGLVGGSSAPPTVVRLVDINLNHLKEKKGFVIKKFLEHIGRLVCSSVFLN